MINISVQSITQKRMMKKRRMKKGKDSGKDAPYLNGWGKPLPPKPPTWAEYRLNSSPKGTHETHRHIHHETDQRPLHQNFYADWNGAEASFQILLYFSSLFHNIDFFMLCRWLHLARFRGQIRTGRKYARLLVKNFQPPGWTDWKIFAKTRRARSGLADF